MTFCCFIFILKKFLFIPRETENILLLFFLKKYHFLFPFRPTIQLELTFYVRYLVGANVHAFPHMNTQLFQHK